MSSYASSVISAEAPAFTVNARTEHYHTTMSSRIRSFGQKTRPQIKISLNGCEDSWVATYSTMDKIEGKVTITCPVATSVDSLSIDFIGTTRTFLERMSTSSAVSGRSEAHHQFLKLTQPIPASAWPENKMFEAGKTYEFNFIFVVPEMLLPRVCRHGITSSHVQQEHIRLPPSFGDRAVAGRGKQLLDDLAPEMARIRYCVNVTLREIAKFDCMVEQHTIQSKKVRILPRVEEYPPIDTDGVESDYVLRQEKDVRKGLFKSKLGRLVMEATQPQSLRIRSPQSDEQAPESTVVKVALRFDPAEGKGAPPNLGNLTTRLKVATFFSSAARGKLPEKKDTQWDMNQGLHCESITLASRCLGHVDWTWNSEEEFSRRSSTVSSMSDIFSTPDASSKYKGEGFWTAQIVMPVSLPANKAWIPTFHTCLVSRTYSLGVHLAVPTGTIGHGIDLKLPVQLSSQGRFEGTMRPHSLSLDEQAVEAMEADEFFAPRTISPMHASFTGRSSIGQRTDSAADLPPEYDAFPRTSNRRAIVA